MSKLIGITHHFDDYECMWNGIEDLYIQATGEILPPSFFFVLSGFGSFCYMKTPKQELKRLIALGDGRTKKMYEFLSPIVSFQYVHHSYSSFDKALKSAIKEIDNDRPCVLGALDMAYLPYYPKLYHGESVPFHYVLLVGYDDDRQLVYVNDCGRIETQTIPYTELAKAWNCSYPGLSAPYTVCTVHMSDPRPKVDISKDALSLKAHSFLYPPTGFLGVRGFDKFISELSVLKTELSKQDYDKLLLNMISFFGTVPGMPNRLRGNASPDEYTFFGGFDKMSRVLKDIGEEYDNSSWKKAAVVFNKGSSVIAEITENVTDYLLGEADDTQKLPLLFTAVKDVLAAGYSQIMEM